MRPAWSSATLASLVLFMRRLAVMLLHPLCPCRTHAHTLGIVLPRYWTLTTERPDQWRPATRSVLPSDSRYRHDLAVLKEGDVKGSQVCCMCLL